MMTTTATGSDLASALRDAIGSKACLTEPGDLRTYECDGLAGKRIRPAVVVLPETTEAVAACVRIARAHGASVVPRGAGTGLSGGAQPIDGCVLIVLSRMNRILEIDLPNGRVRVQPGVINLDVSRAIADDGYYYAPDPSSQSVCSIGGNIAENSGGAHCLKYGFTTTHVLAMDVILPDGERVTFGATTWDPPGYDLRGVFVGSEGTLGIAVKITLRIVRKPPCVQTLLAAFNSTDDAGEAVGRIIAAGILPAAAEMMDRLSIQAAEAAVHAGYPDCEGLLLIELDGVADEVRLLVEQVKEICASCGAWELRLAQSDSERAVFWKGRKAAFAAMGRISPNYIVQDGVIPRTALPQTLREIRRLSAAVGLRVANVFHAGDGNLHPLVLYDRAIPGQEKAAEDLSAEILRLCIASGGSITGEHGVGFEKKEFMSEMYAEPDLQTMQRVRVAFDPLGICNPLKIFPRPRLCGEKPGPYMPHPLVTAGVAELF
jgi:glycolate oxidase